MKTLLFLLYIFSSFGLFGQIQISYGPELGVNMSGIPKIKEHTADAMYVTETKNLPVISPVIGFFGEIQFGKHFLISSDLSYKKVGYTDKGMQSWSNDFTPKEISFLTGYIKLLKGTKPAAPKAQQGVFYVDEVAGTVSDSAAAAKPDSIVIKK